MTDKRQFDGGKAWQRWHFFNSCLRITKGYRSTKEKRGNLLIQSLVYIRYFHINDFTELFLIFMVFPEVEIISISQVRQLKSREGRQIARCETSWRWRSRAVSTGISGCSADAPSGAPRGWGAGKGAVSASLWASRCSAEAALLSCYSPVPCDADSVELWTWQVNCL